jgi:hypothetical protein
MQAAPGQLARYRSYYMKMLGSMNHSEKWRPHTQTNDDFSHLHADTILCAESSYWEC